MKKLIWKSTQDNVDHEEPDTLASGVVLSINKLKHQGNLKRVEKTFVNKISGKSYKKNVQVRISKEPPKKQHHGAQQEQPNAQKTGHPEQEPLVGKKPSVEPTPQTGEKTPDGAPKKQTSKLKPIQKKKKGLTAFHGDAIKNKIASDKDFALEQMLLMQEYQTEPEHKARATIIKNYAGFNKPDAKFFNSFMDGIREHGGLKKFEQSMSADSQNMIMSQIQGRMVKYGNQLADIYNDNNQQRNFKTLADQMKEAKKITDAELNQLDPSIQGSTSKNDWSHLDQFMETLKQASPADIDKMFVQAKKKGPKWTAEGIAKRFDNAKNAAEIWHILNEVSNSKNPTIKSAYQKYRDNPLSHVVDEIMNKGLQNLKMSDKNMLKKHMKEMSSEIAEIFNAYKDLGIGLPVTKKFAGKSLKTIKKEALEAIENKMGQEAVKSAEPKAAKEPVQAPEEKVKTREPVNEPEPEIVKEIEPVAKETVKRSNKLKKVPRANKVEPEIRFDKNSNNNGTVINGVSLQSVKDIIETDPHFFKNNISDVDIYEPPPIGVNGSGIVLVEPDGRIQIREVTGHFDGYKHSFAKGKIDSGYSIQQNAHKELYEETGMIGEIVGFLGDFVGGTGSTRFYIGKRVAGNPGDAGSETDNVKLVSIDRAIGDAQHEGLLNKERDIKIATAVKDILSDPTHSFNQALKTKPSTVDQMTRAQAKQKIAKGPNPYRFKEDEFDIDQSSKAGSNPGGIAIHKATGEKYYVKKAESKDRATNEIIASKLYQAYGLNSPRIDYVDFGDGNVGTATKWIDGLEKFDPTNIAHVKEARKGFLVDAFLANWDVFGQDWDNAHIAPSGEVVRLDPGGALLFRAMKGSGRKGHLFGDKVAELDTFQNHDSIPGFNRSAEVFGDKSLLGQMSQNELRAALKEFSKVDINQVQNIVASVNDFNDVMENVKLRQKLANRHKDIIRRVSEMVKTPVNVDKEKFVGVSKQEVRDSLSPNSKRTLDNNDEWGELTDEKVNKLTSKYKGYSADDIHEISNLLFENMEIITNQHVGAYTGLLESLKTGGVILNTYQANAAGYTTGDHPAKGGTRNIVEGYMSGGALHDYPDYDSIDPHADIPKHMGDDRPVYGYLYDYKQGNTASSYGCSIGFKLKKDALQKVSLHNGDTFNLHSQSDAMDKVCTPEHNYPIVSRVLEINNASLVSPEDMKNKIKNKDFMWHSSFAEAHIYGGGVNLKSDVESIVLYGNEHDPPEKTMKLYKYTHKHIFELVNQYGLKVEIKSI